jgi:hypothetical protein
MTTLEVNGFNIELSDNVVMPLTYSVADIKDPSKRKQGFSKSIDVIGTQSNMSFFRSAWNLTISDVDGTGLGINYDPLLKYNAVVRRNDTIIFDGWAFLRKIKIVDECYVFTVNLFANMVGFYDDLGDINVSELGWSDYDFTLSVANVRTRMTNTTGLGVWYPLVNYGLGTSLTKFKTNELFPHISFFEITKKIFEYVGISISSTFLNSSFFKKIFFGFGGGSLPSLSPTEVSNRRVKFDADGTQTRVLNSSTPTPFSPATVNTASFYTIENVNFSTTTVNDTLNQFVEDAGVIEIARTGSYKVQISNDLDITGSFNGIIEGNISMDVRLQLRRNGSTIFEQQEVVNHVGNSINQILNFNIEEELYLNSGDELQLFYVIFINCNSTTAFNFTNVLDLDNDFTFDLTAINPVIIDGDTVVISSLIPEYKCAKFLKDIILMFNLYFDETDVPNQLFIEPHDDYYLGTDDMDDWSDDVDYSKPIEIIPAGNIEGKNYIFKFTEDLDHYKQKYFTKWGKHYGDHTIQIPTNYAIGDKIFEVGFAQTCPVQIQGTNIIIPFIVKLNEDTGFFTPHKGKPRIYINNGLIACDDFQLVNSDTLAETTYNTYPRAHHLDNLTTATFDLNFGAPDEVFYNATTYTTANLYNKYWDTFIKENTGRDSKMVKLYNGRLNEKSIYKGMFRKLLQIDGVAYKKNLITDFQANGNQSTMVELIRVIAGKTRRKRTFVPAYIEGVMFEPVSPSTDVGDTDYDVATNDLTIKGEPTANNRTYNVDPASMIVGARYVIRNQGIRGIILTPTSGTINGGASVAILSNTGRVYWSDGTNIYTT